MANPSTLSPNQQALNGPEALQQMFFSFTPSRILATAVQLDLFSLIDMGHTTVDELVERANASRRGLPMVLNSLVALGLLGKQANTYTLTPLSKQYLSKQSPDYMGYIVEMDEHWNAWTQLPQCVKTGNPTHTVEVKDHAEMFFPKLVRSLHIMNREPARRMAEALHLGNAEAKVLDIACGSGVWGIAMAQADPNVHVTALDFDKVLTLTREYVQKEHLEDRFTFQAGDLKTADYGSNQYDVAILGNIVHSEGEASSRELFKKLHQALKPGGKVVIIDMIPNDERTGPPFPVMFALNMLVHTETGNTYTMSEYRNWLNDAGFPNVDAVDIGSHSPMLVATKP